MCWWPRNTPGPVRPPIFQRQVPCGPEHFDDNDVATDDHDHVAGLRHLLSIDIANHDHLASDYYDDLAAHHYDDPSCNDLGRHVAMSSSPLASESLDLTARSFRALSTTATVVVSAHADEAERILRDEVDAMDRTCSRFRPDSELAHVHANAGRTVKVSSLLFEALDVAYSVAERTQGAVDPTIGHAMEALGYDRDFERIETRPIEMARLGPVPGFRHLHLDRQRRAVRIPRNIRLDLGSSAKAFLADRAADHIAEELGSGALVSIGGDVAVAGEPPPEGWAIGIAVDSSTGTDDVDQVVAIRQGGLASSSTETRTWAMSRERVHHIVNPATGCSAAPYWRLVSAAGASCVDANALSTAAVVWGDQAIERLRRFDQAVRLLRFDGEVFTLGGWPEEERT